MNLRDILHYNPETGEWTWIKGRPGVKVPQAGTLSKRWGYLQIQIDGKIYKAHRLAWVYMTGKWPKGDIDHINRNRADNRWANLREATRSQNNINAGQRKHNTSGLKGAFFRPDKKNRWQAKIGLNGKGVHLGYFLTKEEAHAAYLEAARKHYGEFANSPSDAVN